MPSDTVPVSAAVTVTLAPPSKPVASVSEPVPPAKDSKPAKATLATVPAVGELRANTSLPLVPVSESPEPDPPTILSSPEKPCVIAVALPVPRFTLTGVERAE